MFLDVALKHPRPAYITVRNETAIAVALALLSVFFYMCARKMFHLASVSAPVTLFVTCASAAISIPFARIRYVDIPKFLSLFIRVIAAVVTVQVFFDSIDATPGIPNLIDFGSSPLFASSLVVALLVGAAAIWRPVFAIPLFGYYLMFRLAIVNHIGIEVVETDYVGMIETGLFSAIGAMVVVCACQWPAARRVFASFIGENGNTGDVASLPDIREQALSLVWAIMVGAHLRNYLFSGLAKLAAGGSQPLTWLFHNNTAISILMGLERGDNPLSRAPWLLQGVWDGITAHMVALNILVLGGQLLAPLGALNRRILIALTIFYDLFHVGVYFTLGALFFYWILINALIFTTSGYLPGKKLTLPMSIAMLLTMALGGKPFYTNHLGWLDGPKIASVQISAETRDGRTVNVPGPFFGIYAYNIAQDRLYLPPGSFPRRTGGNTQNLEDWHDAMTCGPMVNPHADDEFSLGAVQRMIAGADQYARERPWFKNWNTYYFYPHHMVPNPFEYRAFNDLKMRDIVAYDYRVDSVCLSLKGGKLQRDVRKSWSIRVPASANTVAAL